MNPFTPLTLPNGTSLPNRIAKSAMEENLADPDHAPSDELIRLYRAWGDGGVGLIITGNVMIDRRAMTGPGGVVLESQRHLARFQQWAQSARARGAQVWMQINHPGRQMPAALGQLTIAPSAVPMDMGNFSKQFTVPRAMSEDEISEVIGRFVNAAVLAEQAGFDGVQVHAAHGYLISQFLSPLTNKRMDRWGGAIGNRARMLVAIVREIRARVSPGFSLSVKLNSADFQRGGFSPEDARQVVALLNPLGVDLIEISGGSYEAPAMHGQARDGRSLSREAYFLQFAQDIAGGARLPIMVTGGIRRLPVAEQVLEGGIAMVGIGTALALNPALPREWESGKASAPMLRSIGWRNKVLASLAYMAMVKHQLRRLSRGRIPNPGVTPAYAFLEQQLDTTIKTCRYRRWMGRQPA
ncbi:NADH:flavin oxidoreductase/NADH oxidase family protein [Massilia niastensis]|uniref:NADH:flavin oxidoreductase/NADH oxidase family protein n=1 Tax=Massilia niastensis TaxID=544911 RepID=UPI000373FDE2|nr:NADH:flavin oxidoreductase/NADH oxidase family protein [Massilia niastensis]